MLIAGPRTPRLRSLCTKAQMHQLSHKEDCQNLRLLCVLLLLFLFSHQFFVGKAPRMLQDLILGQATLFPAVSPPWCNPGTWMWEGGV